jgi:3-oxoacyl-[acyl-carrier protein] reductase
MSDFFLKLSRNTLARKVVKQTGLPIPLPQLLKRQKAPWDHASLTGLDIGVGGLENQGFYGQLVGVLQDSGANMSAEPAKLDGLLFDASVLETPESLKHLYQFFHHRVGKLKPCSHVLLVSRTHNKAGTPVKVATHEALTGFVRSLGKELGSRGIAVNLLIADEGIDFGGVVRFFLSQHSAFITGQVLTANGHKTASGRYEKLLDGKTILVTGAAQGIGASIARRVAAEGAKVLLLDRPQEMAALEAMAREVHGTIIPMDLLRDDAVAQTVKKLREFAPVHGVVHNAGITRDKTLFKMKSDDWDSVLGLNLGVPVAMTEMMMSKEHDYVCAKDASIVFMSSVGGIAGNPGQTNYAATKAGLIGYARAWAESDRCGQLRFNCVAPGFIETRMTQAMPVAVREVARRLNSLKQGGEPDDVAQAVTFLLSDVAACVNGETIRVCGQNFIGR